MHDLAEHTTALLYTIGILGSGLITSLAYIWKGGASSAKEIAKAQAHCLATLPERFPSLDTYREDIKEIFKRQSDLRERLPMDYIMRTESEIFMGAVKELKSEMASMRQSFEGRMDRLMQNFIDNKPA